MKEKPYVLDDRVIIPDYIKKMTIEELNAEIERLEAEHKAKKRKTAIAG